MKAQDQKLVRLINKLIVREDKSWRSRRTWKKIEEFVKENPINVLLLGDLALKNNCAFRVDAQDLISAAWWKSIQTEKESQFIQLFSKTKSHALAGKLQVYTHLAHNDLLQLISSKTKVNVDPRLIEDFREIISLNNEWSESLIHQTATAIVSLRSRCDDLANLLWDLYFDNHYSSEVSLAECLDKEIIPSSGKYRYLGSAALGGKQLSAIADIGDIATMIEFVMPYVGENKRVSASMSYLISSCEGEILDYFWMLFFEHESSFLLDNLRTNPQIPNVNLIQRIWADWSNSKGNRFSDFLIKWGIPFNGDLKNSRHLTIRAECICLLGRFDLIESESTDVGVSLVVSLCASTNLSIEDQISSFVLNPSVRSIRDELCRLAITENSSNFNAIEICKKNRIAPSDEIQRAVFFLLTNQIEELQVFDPGLDALGLGYLSADEKQRERIRQALIKAPSLSLGEVLAGFNRRDRLSRMSTVEIEYFLDRLFEREEFENVIEISKNLSLTVFVWAVGKIKSVKPNWSPNNRDLFGLFKQTVDLMASHPAFSDGFYNDAKSSRTLNRLLSETGGSTNQWPIGIVSTRINFDGRINDIAFSADGKFLAVAGTNRVVGELDLSKGRWFSTYRGFHSSVGSLFHLGDHRILAGERTNSPTKPCRVLYLNGTDPTLKQVAGLSGSVTSLVGFGEDHCLFTGRNGQYGLISVQGDPKGGHWSTFGGDYPRLAAENSKSNNAIIFNESARLISSSNNRLAVHNSVATPSKAKRAAWISNDRVAYISHSGDLNLIAVDARRNQISVQSSAASRHLQVRDMVLLPNRNQLAVVSPTSTKILSTENFQVIGRLDFGGISIHGSPDGGLLAIGDESGRLSLVDTSISMIPALIGKAIASCTPNDFQACLRASGALAKQSKALGKGNSVIVELLSNLMRFRFRYDISIVDTSTIRTGEYDISLA